MSTLSSRRKVLFLAQLFKKMFQKNVIESLHLVSIIYVLDQAIHAKACKIKWKERHKFRNCLLIMGIFHMLTNYMGILEKRFYDARMKDILLQTATIAEGSIE